VAAAARSQIGDGWYAWAMTKLPTSARRTGPRRNITLYLEETMQARCMKCKEQREMKDPKQITMKNGRPATEGICPVCGTRMFRIGSSK
jgi:Zn finger protein HypA/HybF involved in hydrogenase expression